MRRLLSALAVLLLLAVGSVSALYAYVESSAARPIDPSAKERREFEVPKGASHTQIGKLLVDEKLIESLWVWRVHLKLHPGFDPKAGRHPVSRSMSIVDLRKSLSDTPLPEDEPVTLVEGWRIRDIDEALAKDGWIQPGAYVTAASQPTDFRLPVETTTLEGYLLPETYMVNRKKPLDPKKLIQRQLDSFADRFSKPYAEEIAKSNRKLGEIVIMASMLEREEPKEAMRPKVAGLLWKRIDAKWALGVDATSRFTLADWNDRKAFLAKLRDPDDPYNTRLRKGLPPTAIGSPGVKSLVAALRPEPSEYWYYLHDGTQTIHFGRTVEEHEENRKKYNVY